MIKSRTSRVYRSALLASAGLSLTLVAAPGAAQAQSTRPSDVVDSAHSSARPDDVVDSPQSIGIAPAGQTIFVSPGEVVDTPSVTINNNFTPTDARDPTNITGIGQFVTDAGGGSVGLCTATLINPRTVLLAAHCVNTRAATAYGANQGGVGTGIGFETNTRANGAGQTDELVNWLLGLGSGPGQFKTNTAQAFYNISQVFWNPLSVSATSCTAPTSCFLEADVATAVLDTPTRNIPTWALLFSPLDTPSSINPATGTGYHVTIEGYGRNGTGTTGAVGNDFRRRVAENMLGALTSLNDRNLFLFGTTGVPSRPQVLYFMDFDDPARGTAAANPRDFNSFRDNALTREGLTGPGDSGGPLILDNTFSKQVVIGTLSGGSTFFAGQPGGSYGTQSFYQPLFLYWDWIVANNPYHYVTAVAGNRNWEDGATWLTELDPMYNILSGGQLVNGLPTNLGGGPTGNAPQFGEFCFQSPSSSNTPAVNECQNTDGTIRNNVPNNPSDQAPTSGALTEQVAGNLDSSDVAIVGSYGLGLPVESAQADPGYSDTVRPAATLANGLPGATNFVPNNFGGVRATGEMARYFDVTLRNTGVVTLNSGVTIDKFTVAGATAQLTVASGATLTSLIEINQLTGTVLNNGVITTPGDYFLMSGLLAGTGSINAPFTTSVLGSIAPGTIGTIGTLTFNGNLVLSSGSNLLIDLGAPGVSDRVLVNGAASIGGTVTFGFNNTLRANSLYTFFVANSITGQFNTPAAISGILRPKLIYSPILAPKVVQVLIDAGLYRDLFARGTQEYQLAQILDQNRSIQSQYDALYGPLDLQSAATIRSTLSGLLPAIETTIQSLGVAAVDRWGGFVRQRAAGLDPSNMGGTVARYGAPLEVAAMNLSGSNAGLGKGFGADLRADSAPQYVSEGALPETMSAFLAGGYIDGDSAPMIGSNATGRDEFNGWYGAAGIEASLTDDAAIGFAGSYTRLDGDSGLAGQRAVASVYQMTIYGKAALGGLTLDAQLNGGLYNSKTHRTVNFLGTPVLLQSEDNALVVATEVGLGKSYETGAFKVTPRIAARASQIGFTPTAETGGAMALQYNRGKIRSIQGRGGLTFEGTSARFKPYLSATYVHEFEDRPGFIGANLVGGVPGNAAFFTNITDRNYGEVAGGLTFSSGNVDFSVSAETTVVRKDIETQTYRGSIAFRF